MNPVNASARVLVTDADSPKALAIVRAVGQQHEVWTAAESRLALGGWSRYATRHLKYGFTTADQFPLWLLSVCTSNGIDVVITPEESSSLLAAQHHATFDEHGIHLTNLPLRALQIAMDKSCTASVAAEMGIAIPATITLHQAD